jgi:hypothetical protein
VIVMFAFSSRHHHDLAGGLLWRDRCDARPDVHKHGAALVDRGTAASLIPVRLSAYGVKKIFEELFAG